MAEAKKRFENLSKIKSGTTPSSDLKMKDILAVQHMDATSGTNTLNQISVAQNMCQPIARCSGTPNDGAYVADCINFPDFSLTYTDSQSNQYYLYGLKIRVIFEDGITYGSVDSGTYPTLNINNSGAIPLLAQGLTMAQGAAVAGQSLEFTLIPYGQNGVAWDADTNIRENTSDYTIYTDGKTAVTTVNTVAANNMHSVTSSAVFTALAGKANVVSNDVITSIASLEVTSGSGLKNQYVSSITLPAGSRYLVFFYQRSDVSDTARMDGAYVSDAGEFSVIPNSNMNSGWGSVRIAYYKNSPNNRVIQYGLGYKYNNASCIFVWNVNAIRLA